MCGIVGFWSRGIASQAWLTTMNRVLRHRGPDSEGFFVENRIGLGNRRLSILDLEGGNQPVFNEDKSVVVVYNGEIYNYPQLRDDLESRGHRFHTQTDTEVLVHLYEEYGETFPRYLRGMFAFALYDRKHQRLLLARDPFGIKPLIYAELPQGFFFASEIRSLLALPFFPREIDLEAVGLYTALNYIPAPRTIWRHARRLPPGHWMWIEAGQIYGLEDYRTPPASPSPLTPEDAVQHLENILRESVQAHLLSDVPVGAFLSGGLDSSLVATLAQSTLSTPLRTFTITFPEWPTYDESRYAQEVAEYLGTMHEVIPITAREAQRGLWEAIRHLDEPFADSSLVNVSLVSKSARHDVKVVLSGDGGDEFFAGYNKYQGLRLAHYLTPWRWALKPLYHISWTERRGTRMGEYVRRTRKLLRLLHPEALQRYLRATMQTEPETVNALLNETVPNPLELLTQFAEPLWQKAQRLMPKDIVNQWLWMDTHIVLPYGMLRKVDTASMQHSLEVRVPLVDWEIAKFVHQLPGHWKLRGLQRKWLLRQVAYRLLPRAIVERPKGGFGIPIGEWMRNELRNLFWEYLRPEALRQSVWRPSFVEHLWHEHQTGHRDRFWELWNVFVFEVWRRQWKVNLSI